MSFLRWREGHLAPLVKQWLNTQHPQVIQVVDVCVCVWCDKRQKRGERNHSAQVQYNTIQYNTIQYNSPPRVNTSLP